MNIVGHYNRLTTKKRIDPRLLSRGYSEDALKMLQDRMKDSHEELISLDLHLKGSLDRWDYPYFNYVMTLFDGYDRHGLLPFKGTHAEQPSKILEIFQVLDQLKTEREARIQEEQQREQQKKQRKRKGR